MSPAHAQLPGSPPSTGRARGLRDLGIAYERVSLEEVGFGTAVWLHVTPSAPRVRILGRSSVEQGSATRALRIGETGQVPEIQIDNLDGDPLLLPAHLVLAGGWQTRSVERSVVVAGGASARVPVKC